MKKIFIFIIPAIVILLVGCSPKSSSDCITYQVDNFSIELITKIDTEVGKIPGNDYLNRDDYDYDFTKYDYELLHNFREEIPVGNIVTNGSLSDNKYSGMYHCDIELHNVPNDESYLPEIDEVYYILGNQNENDIYVSTYLFLKLPNYDINKTYEEQDDTIKTLIENKKNGN